jgi:hypothetical protein
MNATAMITIPFEIDSASYSPKFLTAVEGSGAWSREARVLLALAAARGVKLDEVELVWADARDLRARRDLLIGLSPRGR